MAKIPMTKEIKSLQKRFIPANIILCVLALVAMLANLFMPWLDLRFSIKDKALAETFTAMFVENTDEEYTDEITEQTEKIVESSFKGAEIEIPINLYPMGMLSAATGSQEDLEEFLNTVIGIDGVEAFFYDFVDEVAPHLLTAGIATSVLRDITGLSDKQIDQVSKYTGEFSKTLDQLNKGNEDEAREIFVNGVQELAAEYGATVDEDRVNEAFENLADAGTTKEGDFNYIELLKNFDVNSFEFTEDDFIFDNQRKTRDVFLDPSTEKVEILIPSDLTVVTPDFDLETETEDSFDDSEMEEIKEGVTAFEKALENPAYLVVDLLVNELGIPMENMQTVLLLTFMLMSGLPALLWFMLALFAFIRIFMKRKNAKLWYIKAFCFWPLIGIIGGNIFAGFMPSMLFGADAVLAESTAFSFLGSGIVTSVCYVLLIVLSLVWYGPTKRKIKRSAKNNPYDKPASAVITGYDEEEFIDNDDGEYYVTDEEWDD